MLIDMYSMYGLEGYGVFTVVCPGWDISITPPQLHIHFDV
jgi:hypothetical protein